MDIKEMLNNTFNERKDEDGIIEKTITMRSHWKERSEELDELKKELLQGTFELKKVFEKIQSRKKLLFGIIEKDLGIYDKSMKIDDKNNQIIIYKD